MKKMLILPFFSMALFTSAYAKGLSLFSSEVEAQAHCPKDEVVWLNLPTGIWHNKSGRWYGTTKNGAYVCKVEAQDAGDRASLNG